MWIMRATYRASQRGEMSLSYVGVVAVVALLVVALLASGAPRWGDGIGRGVSCAIDRVVSWGGGRGGCGSSGSGGVAASPAQVQSGPPIAPAPGPQPDAAELPRGVVAAQSSWLPQVFESLDAWQDTLLVTVPKILLGAGAAALATGLVLDRYIPIQTLALSPYWWVPDRLMTLGLGGMIAGASIALGHAVGGPLGWLIGASAASLATGWAIEQDVIPPGGLGFPRGLLIRHGLIALPQILLRLGAVGLIAGGALYLGPIIGNALGWWDAPSNDQRQPPPK